MNIYSIAHGKGRISLDLTGEILQETISLEIHKKDVVEFGVRSLLLLFIKNGSRIGSYRGLAGGVFAASWP